MTLCYRCIVSGRVQGVFFRASTQAQARQWGVTGHAKNLPDGHVEVLACGEAEFVDALKAWLWHGPAAAKVDTVQCQTVEIPAPAQFSIG
ncbi:MAG: acylphosphatase [Gammaproteobacteria bacterium]|nr:acylphosphatase [Gammaproteobacteria bacterium]